MHDYNGYADHPMASTFDVGGTTVRFLREMEGEATLIGDVEVFGREMHVYFIRVADRGGVQEAVNDPHGRFRDLAEFNDEAVETVRIPGHPGDWAAVVFPMAR